jgi:hypothetical protein
LSWFWIYLLNTWLLVMSLLGYMDNSIDKLSQFLFLISANNKWDLKIRNCKWFWTIYSKMFKNYQCDPRIWNLALNGILGSEIKRFRHILFETLKYFFKKAFQNIPISDCRISLRPLFRILSSNCIQRTFLSNWRAWKQL